MRCYSLSLNVLKRISKLEYDKHLFGIFKGCVNRSIRDILDTTFQYRESCAAVNTHIFYLNKKSHSAAIGVSGR